MVKPADLSPFDMAKTLKSEYDIAAYLSLVQSEGDAEEIQHANEVVAKAREILKSLA